MNILILKTGKMETFVVNDAGGAVSFGDVLRTTPLLRVLQKDHVTWFTSEKCILLLPVLKNLTVCVNLSDIDFEQFDLILNLERDVLIQNTFNKCLNKNKWLGFCWDEEGLLKLKTLSQGSFSLEKFLINFREKNWTEKLFTILNRDWDLENYYLNPNIILDSSKEDYDIGLNWMVGSKWPEKAWHEANWKSIHGFLSVHSKVSWQEGFNNLIEYVNWIYRCKKIITIDSFGLHLAIALDRPVVGLFLTTSPNEIPIRSDKVILLSKKDITPQDVAKLF